MKGLKAAVCYVTKAEKKLNKNITIFFSFFLNGDAQSLTTF